jgi:hypothetical protein
MTLRNNHQQPGTPADQLPIFNVLADLREPDEASWDDLDSEPPDARRLPRELPRYMVRPIAFEPGEAIVKGYVTYDTTCSQTQTGLTDAWSRYLPAVIGNSGKNGKPASQPLVDAHQLTDPSINTDRLVSP